MSASCSVHRCHDDDDSGTSPTSHKADEEEAAGEAAMAMAATLERVKEVMEDARRNRAESSGSKTSQQGGGSF